MNFYKNKNTSILGNWIDNNLEGLAIFFMEDLEERIWLVEKDKKKSEITDNNELNKIKDNKNYKELKEFFYNIKKMVTSSS